MDKLTKEQADVVLEAVNKIAAAMAVMCLTDENDVRYAKFLVYKNEAVDSLRAIGVGITK